MGTTKQKRVARKLIENISLSNPKTGGEIVESSGYGVSMKKNPHVVMKSRGVKEELRVLGFDEVSAKKVVSQILNDTSIEPSPRLKAADMVFQVSGSYAPSKNFNVEVKVEVDQKIAKGFDEYLRGELKESSSC